MALLRNACDLTGEFSGKGLSPDMRGSTEIGTTGSSTHPSAEID